MFTVTNKNSGITEKQEKDWNYRLYLTSLLALLPWMTTGWVEPVIFLSHLCFLRPSLKRLICFYHHLYVQFRGPGEAEPACLTPDGAGVLLPSVHPSPGRALNSWRCRGA